MAGVKVVELAIWAAGPIAGALLADWGADVIKVEPPRGDPFRFLDPGNGTNEEYFSSVADNRGKRGLALDLQSAEGRVVLLELLAGADVFVTNLRLQALAKLGLDYGSLGKAFPRLVYALLTGYGTEGPDINRPAFDVGTWWGRAGVAQTLLSAGAVPMFHAGAIGDHSTGLALAAGIGAALFARERSGSGQLVDASMLRSGAFFLSSSIGAQLNGRPTRKLTRGEVANMLSMPYQAGDGKWFVLLGGEPDRVWPALARTVGRPEWIEDARYSSAAARAERRTELVAALDAIFATRRRAEWAEHFDREGVWWSPMQTLEELDEDQQMRAAGCFRTVSTRWGERRLVPGPVNFAGSAGTLERGSPAVGEHSDDILRALGYGKEKIAGLRARKVIA
jgi:crotonobetainyl-CoA:carnitine CoA-transferase CaiB-like acyl-CoA transferase